MRLWENGHRLKICIVVLLFCLSSFILGRYFSQKTSQPSSLPQKNFPIPSDNKAEEWSSVEGIIYNNISEQDAEKYIALTRQFENAQLQHDAKAVLSLFSPPSNKEEENSFDSISGKDILDPRLYMTRVYNYSLNWFLIKSISKTENDSITVDILESRTYPCFCEEATIEMEPVYSKDMRLLLDILPEGKIQKYYFLDKKQGGSNKYDGFNYIGGLP